MNIIGSRYDDLNAYSGAGSCWDVEINVGLFE